MAKQYKVRKDYFLTVKRILGGCLIGPLLIIVLPFCFLTTCLEEFVYWAETFIDRVIYKYKD